MRRLSFVPAFRRPRSLIALPALVLLLIVGYWLAPIQGQVFILAGSTPGVSGVWPQIWADPPVARPLDDVTIYVRDNAPWNFTKLLIDEVEVPRDLAYAPGSGPWPCGGTARLTVPASWSRRPPVA